MKVEGGFQVRQYYTFIILTRDVITILTTGSDQQAGGWLLLVLAGRVISADLSRTQTTRYVLPTKKCTARNYCKTKKKSPIGLNFEALNFPIFTIFTNQEPSTQIV